jgi:hypothetical protein
MREGEVIQSANYRQESNSELEFKDLPRDALVKLLKLYSNLLRSVDGLWYLGLKDRVGNEEALAYNNWLWERTIRKYLVNDIKEILQIDGTSIVDFVRVLQARPMYFGLGEEIKRKNDNEFIINVPKCPVLEALEREGEGRDAIHCRLACTMMREKQAEFFNPNIQVRALKLPPRKSRDEICCRWEYKGE